MTLPKWEELPPNVKGSPKKIYELIKSTIDELETPTITENEVKKTEEEK